MIVGEPTFYLKSCTDPKKERIIIMQLSLGRKDKLTISTGEKIHPDEWDFNQQWPKGKKNQTKIHVLKKHKQALETVVEELKLANIDINSKEIKWRLEKALNKKGKEKPKSFTQLFEKWRDGVQSQTILTSEGKKYGANTYRPISSTLQRLQDYEAEVGPLTFDRIDMSFYEGFTNFLCDKKYSINYVGTQLKNIKTFLKWAWRNKYTKNEIWRDPSFRKLSEPPTTIYLTKDEIEQMYRATITDQSLSKHRYTFVLNCYLGLRFTDLRTFCKNASKHIVATDRGKLVNINTEKTNAEVFIPLHPIAEEILAIFDGDLPSVPSNAKFNEYIKKIGEIARINKSVVVVENRGGVRHHITRPKHELITTHTARRSFATNLYLAKFPVQDIMRLTGHKSEKTFMRYIRAEALEVAYTMLDHDYFKK